MATVEESGAATGFNSHTEAIERHADKRRQSRIRKKWSQVREQVQANRHLLNVEQLKELRAIFASLDRDGNGTVAAGELLRAMRCMNQSLTEAELNDLLAELVVDSSGKVRLHELCLFVGDRTAAKHLQADLEEFLRTLDSDGKWHR
ncbi:unnamed protein product [Dicrocoelium dendriticum]|nr:unnamed protein product [Dicrocoelium dendriticum]